jgi:transcriptional regulator with XRE-family HTH domain
VAKKTSPLLPVNALRLQQFGDRLRLARLRRRLTGKQVAERAGMTAVTLRNLERGNAGVTLGAYLAVMQVLGAEQDLDLLLKEDPLGRELQDAALPRRSRAAMTEAAPKKPAPSRPSAKSSASSPRSRDWTADSSFVSTDSLLSLIKSPKSGKEPREG